jgi:predicted lipid-binding transport protein (Tim44 family)
MFNRGTAMFASQGFRLSALFVVLLTMFSVVAVDTAEARRGGSFGSRGTRTYQTVPATPTSPGITAPVQRTTAAPTSASRGGIAQTTPAQRAGWFGGGIGGWIIGGLLFSGLFGLLFGAGFGGFGGMLALLFQVVIIGLVLSWLFGRRRQPAMAGGANASPYTAPQDWRPGGGSGSSRPHSSGSAASMRAGRRDEVGIGNRDLDAFEQRLNELQNAYAREDYEALRQITTSEMMGYLSQELGENASKGVRNEVFDVRLLSGDIAEAWREGSDQYATVSLRYESRDITRDRSTGRIVSGDDRVTQTTELWTFLRRGSGPWLVSAIQET